jgi:L,D-transpeptidase-like protein
MSVRRIVAVLAIASAASVGVGLGAHHGAATSPPKPTAAAVATTTTSTTLPPALVLSPTTTLTATLHSAVPGSPEPGAPENLMVPASWYGYPSVLPVIDTVPNWVEVRLAQRPNESTTWVPVSDVRLSVTPYSLTVNLATKQLTVDAFGKPILEFPAGIGTPDDPTVTGHFFITMRVPPPDPGYGPFVLVTSAHSDAITDWAESGDAIIAIHGPITSYDDSLIGTTGAAISHGCIRLHDADLAQLDMIPAGTPLNIISGTPA